MRLDFFHEGREDVKYKNTCSDRHHMMLEKVDIRHKFKKILPQISRDVYFFGGYLGVGRMGRVSIILERRDDDKYKKSGFDRRQMMLKEVSIGR